MGKLDPRSEALATVYIQTEGLHSDVLHRVSVECGQYEYGHYGHYGQHGQYGHNGQYGQHECMKEVTW